MKKISYLLTAACAIWALTSCEADKTPVYHAPTEGSFSLYTPAMQDLYIQLAEGQFLELTTSGQPDYGYSALANYSAQMSLDGDFSDLDKVYDLTPSDSHQSKMLLKQEDVASGVCELLGLDSEETYTNMFPNGFSPMTLYFRAICSLSGVDGSEIISNVVSYNNITPYFNVATPGYIYLIGKASGWNEPNEGHADVLKDWRLFEPDDAIGSKVYVGKFEINEGEAQFRFYSALTGWGSTNCYGAGEEDQHDVPVEMVDGSYTGKVMEGGQSNWDITNWPGGEMTIVVDMSNPNDITITCSAGDVEVFVASYIYIVGNYAGNWIAPNEANKDQLPTLANSSDAKNIYTGSLTFEEPKDLWFRFATVLGPGSGDEWEGSETIGWQEEDEGATFELTNNAFSGAFVQPGSGSWNFNLPEAGTFYFIVNFDSMTVDYSFEPAE